MTVFKPSKLLLHEKKATTTKVQTGAPSWSTVWGNSTNSTSQVRFLTLRLSILFGLSSSYEAEKTAGRSPGTILFQEQTTAHPGQIRKVFFFQVQALLTVAECSVHCCQPSLPLWLCSRPWMSDDRVAGWAGLWCSPERWSLVAVSGLARTAPELRVTGTLSKSLSGLPHLGFPSPCLSLLDILPSGDLVAFLPQFPCVGLGLRSSYPVLFFAGNLPSSL